MAEELHMGCKIGFHNLGQIRNGQRIYDKICSDCGAPLCLEPSKAGMVCSEESDHDGPHKNRNFPKMGVW